MTHSSSIISAKKTVWTAFVCSSPHCVCCLFTSALESCFLIEEQQVQETNVQELKTVDFCVLSLNPRLFPTCFVKESVLTQGANKQMSLEDRRGWKSPGRGPQSNYWYSIFALSVPFALMGAQFWAGLRLPANWVPHASSSATQTSDCSSSIKNYCYTNCSTPNWIPCCKILSQAIGEVSRQLHDITSFRVDGWSQNTYNLFQFIYRCSFSFTIACWVSEAQQNAGVN